MWDLLSNCGQVRLLIKVLTGWGRRGCRGFGLVWKEAPTVSPEEDPSVILMGAVGGLSITVLEDDLTGHLKINLKGSLIASRIHQSGGGMVPGRVPGMLSGGAVAIA